MVGKLLGQTIEDFQFFLECRYGVRLDHLGYGFPDPGFSWQNQGAPQDDPDRCLGKNFLCEVNQVFFQGYGADFLEDELRYLVAAGRFQAVLQDLKGFSQVGGNLWISGKDLSDLLKSGCLG